MRVPMLFRFIVCGILAGGAAAAHADLANDASERRAVANFIALVKTLDNAVTAYREQGGSSDSLLASLRSSMKYFDGVVKASEASATKENLGTFYVRSLILAAHDVNLPRDANEQAKTEPTALTQNNFQDAMIALLNSGKTTGEFLEDAKTNFPSGTYAAYVTAVNAANTAVNGGAEGKPVMPTPVAAGASADAATTAITNATTNTGTASILPESTAFPALVPAALAFARVDTSHFPDSSAVTSSTYGALGQLTGYTLDPTLSFGSSTAGTVCAASECPQGGTIRWGVWSSGTATLSGMTETISVTNPLHYIVGAPTTPDQFAALTGSVSYVPIGGTAPTGSDGRTYSATIGNIAVNFGVGSATLSSYALSGHAINSANFTFNNVPLTLADSGTAAKVLSAVQSNGAGNYLNFNGFFAGAGASYIGAAVKVLEPGDFSGPGLTITQVQAFSK